jgi:hypothetical protein
MEENLETKLEKTVGQLIEQVKSALCLDIYTYGTDILKPDDAPDKKRALAEMHLSPDGDIKQVLPAHFLNDTITVNQEIYAVHSQAVQQAIQTRKEMLDYAKKLIIELKALIS